MWPIVGFLAAALLGVCIALALGRRAAPHRQEYPWLLDEVAKLHVGIVGTLAGFAFTGVVLVVSLPRSHSGPEEISFESVVLMFLVAYLYWVGSAFLISYVPHAARSGDLVQRIHFSLSSTIEYRTVFLSWFALLPLLQANGMSHLAPALYVLLPVSLALGSILLAMASDGLGLVRLSEVYQSAGLATALALGYAALVWIAHPAARTPYSTMTMAIVIFCVNGLGFALAALTPLSPRYPKLAEFFERHGRRVTVTDMQLTMVSLAFLWLAVVGII